ncbi:MAG: hypothetical protein J6W28_02875 [Clostridia bacterium]|nr:hypothetical protein [Clostridia bacterium]
MGSLSKFIEKHLANKKIEDYESWLSLYGKDADKQYGERLASAERTFAKGHATYGDLAADLKDKGLTGSGYGEYLEGKAYERYVGSRESALAEKEKTEADNKSRYGAYRTEREESAREEADSLYRKAINSLFSSKVIDAEGGAAYLAAFGITGDTAIEMAKLNQDVKSGSEERGAVFRYCVENFYDRNQTIAYAMGMGLSEKEATQLGDAMEKILSRYYD